MAGLHAWRGGTLPQKRGLWHDGKFEDRSEPHRYGTLFDLDNHPVVGVTWYEALAFTRWLNKSWHDKSLLSKKYGVILPAESQWEKAARGGLEIPPAAVPVAIDALHKQPPQAELQPNPERQCIFPWGHEPDAEKANYDERHIRTTNAVGSFPNGSSPYGCEEMSGNVYEWCLTKWRENYETPDDASTTGEDRRVVRGGSYFDNHSVVRCSARGGGYPGLQSFFIGFRVALSTSDL
ncbi:SUMF1/EgtB/PvdO family nonheme iron enzyme [candidate division KSB1 bacterium]|nr:SUMF1/EgtB/PvdO family nonheme iron enzyme [candidate division KSB1 bacterium]